MPWDNIPLDAIVGKGGPLTLLAIVVWMILTGRLVPRSTHQDKIAECQKWEGVALKAMEQNSELLRATRTAEKVISALPPAGGES
jgi:hypothetical protein